MAKYTIICSPQTKFEYRFHIPKDSTLSMFPEGNSSASDTFEMINYYVDNKIPLAIVTRRSESLNMIGQLIDEGKISADDVEVILIREETVDKFKFDPGGFLTGGWPIMILDSWE
jgi:hypothetical protein